MDSRHAPAANAYAESPPTSPPPGITLTPRASSKGFANNNNGNARGSLVGMTGPGPRPRTGAGAGGTTDSPPRTPPPRHLRGKGKQRRVDQVVDEAGDNDNLRHSHGLSWNSTTRDSVVDNLLFSLDNLSRDVGTVEAQDDDRHRFLNSLKSGSFTMGGPSRSRGHTHSSSTSASDYTASPPSDISTTPKGRRSTSTTHFSLHTERGRGRANGRVNGIPEAHAELFASSSGNRNHSEEVNSVHQAFGAALDTNRLAWNGKSASMDNLYTERSADSLSVLTRGRPVPSVHSKYESNSNSDADAAPEPIVAAGPRKMQNPTATGPVYVNPAPKAQPPTKPATIRKVTTQTDLRSANSTQSSLIPQDIRNQAADFVRTSSMRGSANGPPVSAQSNNPAPSPDVTRRREPSPPRERPGFFKRVFGGASSRAVSNPAERPVSKHVAQDAIDRPDAPSRSISQASAGNHSRNETKHTMPVATPQPPPSLNKKPSSFFRRRKKSTSESIATPPPLPTNAVSNANVNASTSSAFNIVAEPSPSISSLRKVMDPFLTESLPKPGVTATKNEELRSQTSTSAEDSEDPDLFHTGYTPPLESSLKMRHPLSREQSAMQMSDQEGSPVPKMKLKKRRPDDPETSRAQPLTSNGYIQDPSSQTSIRTLQDQANGQPKVSPISTIFPPDAKNVDLNSRPSTGDRIISQENSPVESAQDMRDFSAGTNVSLSMNEEEWGIVTKTAHVSRPGSKKSEHLVLRPTPSEENLEAKSDAKVSPMLSSSNSPTLANGPDEPSASAKDLVLPVVQVDGGNLISRDSSNYVKVPDEFKERARKIFEGDEEDVVKADAAAWMGERNTLSTKTLEAYMQLFDFSGLNVLAALRMLCNKLVLRGETQQFDRIITALSSRWCECNPNHGFKAQDVIHCICYSLILLNTDLHLADIDGKMSRSAYVKNTLPTIKRVVSDAAPNAFEDTLRPAPQVNTRPTMPWSDSNSIITSPTSTAGASPISTLASPFSDTASDRPDSFGIEPSTLSAVNTNIKRLSIRPAVKRNDSDTPDSATLNASNSLVNNTWTGTMRGWESEMETVLKYFFTSIKAEPLPLHGAVVTDLPLGSNRNLSVVDLNGSVRRSGSIISKAPSDNMSYRSKGDLRSMTMRWQGRGNRPRPKVYPASTIGSSRTSFDDGSGFWSPAQSSKYSFNKTLTSASVGSFGYVDPFKHSIGFANALSEAIIREENTGGGDSETFSMPGGLLEDESLALEGAPWAKEGLVKHKHHLETPSRKAKERSWNDCFAVVSKGKLTLFAFNTSSKSHSAVRKPFYKSGKAASVTGTRVGGGDWMENAEQLDVFVLRQTIASTLPPPGYSKARPHVWALSLPSGAVHLFQVGTPDIAEEFISAANYWSARLSKEPLSGGVSNVEYGWSDRVINTALVDSSDSTRAPPVSMNTRPMGHTPSLSTERARTSLQSSIRGSFDTGFGSLKAKLPGDKAHLHEWQPPTQSMMASQLLEVDQLRQLTTYVAESEKELQSHQELKHAIELAFSPRHPNHSKAMGNWQRKSDYLLREIIKFRTYIDSLTAASKAKEAFYAKKAEGRLSPVAKDDDEHNTNLIGNVLPRVIHTSG